jgi:hypothetical protein
VFWCIASVIFFPPAAPAIAPLAAIATGVKSISLLESVSIEFAFHVLRGFEFVFAARMPL